MAELYLGNKRVLGIKPPGQEYISFVEIKKLVGYIIDIPDGTTTIVTNKDYYGSFNNDRIYKVNIPEGVQTLGASAFTGSRGLRVVEIPEGVTTLGDECFRDCSALETIILPDSLQTIGGSCFEFDLSLREIILPESLEALGGGCFGYCSSLKNIIIPASVNTIGGGAFYHCDSLESITLKCGGQNLTVGDFLYEVPTVTKVYFEGDPFPVNSDTFSGVYDMTFYHKADNPNWTSDITTPTWGGAARIEWATY